MIVREQGDPRLEALFGVTAVSEAGVRPVVRLPRPGAPKWVYAAAVLLTAVLLFVLIEARRARPVELSVRTPSAERQFGAAPELYIPPAAPLVPTTTPVIVQRPVPATVMRTAAARPTIPYPSPVVYVPPAQPASPLPQTMETAARPAAGPPLVIDATGASEAPVVVTNPMAADTQASRAPSRWGGRVRASTLANRSDTIAQGTVIAGVLETALNSTQSGLVRALVARDVHGFDGSKVLIPRGSRLVGEYRSDVAPGQNRAVILWTRLILPSGVTVSLSSPATDPLGRGGVRGRVNTHLVERLTGALLQTTMNLGSALTRSGGNVIIATPSESGAGGGLTSGQARPTLTVAPGKSISVFVAHDLDFSNGSQRE